MHIHFETKAMQFIKVYNLTPWLGFEPMIFCPGGRTKRKLFKNII
jgi:hypothetical protein